MVRGKSSSAGGYVAVVIVMLALLLLACAAPARTPTPSPAPAPKPSPAPKPAFQWPKPLAWTSLDVGSGGYVMAAAVADTFTRQAGVETNVIPCGTEVGRIVLMANKRVHTVWMGPAFFSQEGLEEFASIDMGPQPMRFLIGSMSSWGLGSTKSANIKSLADLKGKRVSWVVGSPATNANTTGLLAFANLTWKDVIKVEFPSTSAAGRGLLDGAVDAHQGNTTAARYYELMATPRGLYFVPLPHNDKEGWKRFQQIVPHYFPRVITEGAGLSETNTYDGGTCPNPALYCHAEQDPELVYQQTKLMVELYDKYSKVDAPGIKDFAVKYQSFEWVVPYHEGAIRYYKEIGKWTDTYQKHNDRLVERQRVLKQAWDKAIAEAIQKKLSVGDYSKLWYQVRGQTLKAAGFEPYYKAPGFVPWD